MPTSINRKVACINPNTGRRMNIDRDVHELFSKAIYHALRENKNGITYTDIVNEVKKCFKQQHTNFKGSVGWYTVTVKHDMHARRIIEVFSDKGKKLHRLKK